MGREENVKVFQDTERLVKERKVLLEAVKYSTKNQILIPEYMPVADRMPGWGEWSRVDGDGSKDSRGDGSNGKNSIGHGSVEDDGSSDEEGKESSSVGRNGKGRSDEGDCGQTGKIVVSKKRTYEAAAAYKGKKVCVHNFASATNPGGGVTKGSSAQEECLCRCSTLYFNLNTSDMWGGFYAPHRTAKDPVHNDDCIYTPDVVVFKTDTAEPKLMPEEEWYKVNVVTCAAPNLRLMPSNGMNGGDGMTRAKLSEEELYHLHVKRLSRIMEVAAAGGNEVMILGAFGCGAFENNPEVVAKASKTVAEKYRNCFDVIEFAIYCSPWEEQNYRIFSRVI